MADTDTAPRRRRTQPTEPGASPRLSTPEFEAKSPGSPIRTLQRKLEVMIGGMALPFAAAGDLHCAQLVATRAEPIAEAWANLAAQSPAVRKVLESMLRGGAWAGAIGTTLPLFVGIAAHHGMIPEQYANPLNAMIFGPGETQETNATGPEHGTEQTPGASTNGATGDGPGSYGPVFPGGDTPVA